MDSIFFLCISPPPAPKWCLSHSSCPLKSKWMDEWINSCKFSGKLMKLLHHLVVGLGSSEKASGPVVPHLLGPPEDDEHFKDSQTHPTLSSSYTFAPVVPSPGCPSADASDCWNLTRPSRSNSNTICFEFTFDLTRRIFSILWASAGLWLYPLNACSSTLRVTRGQNFCTLFR